MTGYEPRFDHDYAYGRQGELLVGDMLAALGNGHGRIETKTKRRLDDWIYVELMHDPGGTGDRWKPSGLNVTEAEWWAYSLDNTGLVIFIPTDLLRWAIDNDHGRPTQTSPDTDNDNPTSGRLLRLGALVQALSQWRLRHAEPAETGPSCPG